ncbi:hypothetical protein [Brucella pseudogrignonensis]|uniref:hypothetical protein n=1 Tax=Brucella pseudogrignonensis TaxID=419475 RepID=UPI0038CFE514
MVEQSTLLELGKLVVAFIAGTGLVGFLTKHRLDKAIEKMRAENAIALEQRKSALSSQFDRSVRLNTIRFEIVPTIWQQLLDLHDVCYKLADKPYLTDILLPKTKSDIKSFFQYHEIDNKNLGEALTSDNYQSICRSFYIENISKIVHQSKYDFNHIYLRKIIFIPDSLRREIEGLREMMLSFLSREYEYLGYVEDEMVRHKNKRDYIVTSDIAIDRTRAAITRYFNEGD